MYNGTFGVFTMKRGSTRFVLPVTFLVRRYLSDETLIGVMTRWIQQDNMDAEIQSFVIFRHNESHAIDKLTLSLFAQTPPYLAVEVVDPVTESIYFICTSDTVWNDRIIRYAIGPSLFDKQPYIQQWVREPLYELLESVFEDRVRDVVSIGKKKDMFVEEISRLYLNNKESKDSFLLKDIEKASIIVDSSACITSRAFGHTHTKTNISGIYDTENAHIAILHHILTYSYFEPSVNKCIIVGNEYMTVGRINDVIRYKGLDLTDDNTHIYILLQEYFEKQSEGIAYIPLIQIKSGSAYGTLDLIPRYCTGTRVDLPESTDDRNLFVMDEADVNIYKLLRKDGKNK